MNDKSESERDMGVRLKLDLVTGNAQYISSISIFSSKPLSWSDDTFKMKVKWIKIR